MMIYKYEVACREAGFSEEKTNEIRKMFDAEKKKLKRRKAAHDKCGYGFFSIEELTEASSLNGQTFDIPDTRVNVEEEVMHHCELERLNEVMAELDPLDRQFLLDCFELEYGAEKQVAEKYGMTRSAVQYRKRKLIQILREKF